MHRLLQSLLERQLTDKKHTRPVRTAPLPVDQVPGWREALVTTWAKVEAERTRATTSGRSFGNMSAVTRLRGEEILSTAGGEGNNNIDDTPANNLQYDTVGPSTTSVTLLTGTSMKRLFKTKRKGSPKPPQLPISARGPADITAETSVFPTRSNTGLEGA